MVRPYKERRVEQLPPISCYKPAGISLCNLEEITITVEEMEAIRLADIEQLDQAAAAERMEVSRPTFHRIVNRAHQKIAMALWQGYALHIDGGNFHIAHHQQKSPRVFLCKACGHQWNLPHGNGQSCHDLVCPICFLAAITRQS